MPQVLFRPFDSFTGKSSKLTMSNDLREKEVYFKATY
jgi:hypothetical protein